MGAELAAGDDQNLNDADFTCSLFRFLQLTCEGHNLGMIPIVYDSTMFLEDFCTP